MNPNFIKQNYKTDGCRFRRKILIFVLLLYSYSSFSQSTLTGVVVEWNQDMKMEMPVTGANLYWLPSLDGTTTDQQRRFTLRSADAYPAKLVVSFVGYKADTILVNSNAELHLRLEKSVDLKEVQVAAKQEAVGLSTINPLNVERISEKEILKAACCNLSEAFETSPTVNVSYKDAVTGAKEIQLLGLAGIYSQLMTENIPNMRGIAAIYGLSFIPGPWMESIQVTKGSGSVVNGYESTTGQINVEFKKPAETTTPKFHLNLFGEENGNAEINTFYKQKVNSKWSTLLFLHGNYMDRNIDRNKDGFLDMMHNKQFNVYNRWNYHSGKKLESQLGVRFLADKREGGQLHSIVNPGPHPHPYLTSIETRRLEVYGKLGFVFPETPFKSIGNIVQATVHDMNSSFGLKSYNATQKTFYFQSIYQNILWKSEHQYKAGVAFRYEDLEQTYNYAQVPLAEEAVPGIFFEYTYNHVDRLTLVAGLREDYHQKYGWVFTPRFHGKYNFTDNFLVRLSTGKSFRVPYLYADNISSFASSRDMLVREEIQPEKAWNYGINLTWKFEVNHREGSFSADFYRTDFMNQLVMDSYSDSSRILFYNLNGDSYSNSFQVMLNYELIENLGIRLAYKLDDVKSTYNGILEQKPLVSREKALANISFETKNEHWRFDYTLVWDGPKKLETTFTDPEAGSLPSFSPDFFIMHFQVTKVF
ncbi:MAG TPA: TonB-dependent receptor, partial [Bacteroidia bacterium]|nr:TonB-dependent receptor [Bacteroidia bacterium]